MVITISIDDLHPEQGWGCEGDDSVGYLEELNKEFGCKFTLFIPSNYHEKYPLSKHQSWVDFKRFLAPKIPSKCDQDRSKNNRKSSN